jgi:gliding motility-associated-like protein
VAYVTISSGTPPFNIQWDDPSGQTNDTATALCAGVYTATVTDFNGCVTTVSVTILSTPTVAINATITNANCGVCDGAAIAAPSGGTAPYTLVWSNGQSGLSATNLCSGLYTVNVTDSAGCVSNFGVPVSNTNGPTSLAITSTNITCNGQSTGAVTGITPAGGTAPFTYLWIQGGQTTPTLNNLAAGPYYVEVTDVNGCSITDSVLITEPSPIVANQVVNAATCGMSDGSIIVSASGGSGTYTYLWNTGSGNDTISNLSTGVYSVQITDAGTGCVENVVIPMNNFNGPAITISSTNVTCNSACNGTATVSPAGLTSYLWNDVSAQTTPVATGLCPGNYAVVVTGSNGCSSVGTVTITEPPVMGFSVANTVDPLCNGDTTGTITAIPSGGTLPYTYSWNPSAQTGLTASNLGAGTYTVTVTDGMGCTATQATTLTQTNALTIVSLIMNPSCSSLSDGSVDVTVAGGTSTYTYIWSGSSTATTEDIGNIGAGTYIINVTDGNGCTIADTSILVPLQSVIVSAGNDTTFCQNGSITLNAVSATATTYQWYELTGNTVGNTMSVSVNPPSGTNTYYVVADNGTGCTANDTITLTSNVQPQVDAGADVIIIAGASATIGGNPTTTTGNSIFWSPLPGLDNGTASNPVATPAATTTYVVTVTTSQGCSASDSVLVTVLPMIVIPDGISPNADGDNDEWIIDGIELFPNCVVEVYNRWGELLFQSVGYKEHWKGTYKGKDLPVGSYYYVIDLKDEKFPDVYTGPITILR